MAQTNTQLTVDIMVKIARTLNSEIERTGQIQINNPIIWGSILHKMDNTIWQGILELMQQLNQQHPQLLTISDTAAFDAAQGLLNRYSNYYDSVLDMRNRHVDAKKTAWKCLMSVREIYCRCVDLDLPNSNASKITSTYGSIFE